MRLHVYKLYESRCVAKFTGKAVTDYRGTITSSTRLQCSETDGHRRTTYNRKCKTSGSPT